MSNIIYKISSKKLAIENIIYEISKIYIIKHEVFQIFSVIRAISGYLNNYNQDYNSLFKFKNGKTG